MLRGDALRRQPQPFESPLLSAETISAPLPAEDVSMVEEPPTLLAMAPPADAAPPDEVTPLRPALAPPEETRPPPEPPPLLRPPDAVTTVEVPPAPAPPPLDLPPVARLPP